MKVKREKVQIKVKQDKYYLSGSAIVRTINRELGGQVNPTTPEAIAKTAEQLGNTVPNSNSLKYRNLSQVDESWVDSGSSVLNNTRVQGNSYIRGSRVKGNILVNNSVIRSSDKIPQTVNHWIIENSDVSNIEVRGENVENVIIRNSKVSDLIIYSSDIQIIDSEVSGITLGKKDEIGNVEINGSKVVGSSKDSYIYNGTKFINSEIKISGFEKSEINNCTIINSDNELDSLQFFYMINVYEEKSKFVAKSCQYVYVYDWLYYSDITIKDSMYIILKLKDKTSNTIFVDSAIASKENYFELKNYKNENLTVTGSVIGTKIFDGVRCINSTISGKFNLIYNESKIENSIIDESTEHYIICEKSHIIDSTIFGKYNTIKGNATICGNIDSSAEHNIICGSAYVKQLLNQNNMIFNSSLIESYTGDEEKSSYISGDSYVNGSYASGDNRGDNMITNSNYQVDAGGVKVSTSKVVDTDISNKIVINSELINEKNVKFDEHDDRIWE